MTDVKLDDAAFDDLYAQVLTPALAPHEAERERLVKRFWKALKLGALVAVCLIVPLIVMTGDGDLVYFGLVIVGVFAGLAYWPTQTFETRCKGQALTALAGALGMTYVCDGFVPPRLQHLLWLGLLDSWDDSSTEDLFSGTRNGCEFQLYEARLTEGQGKNRRTVFSGQIIRIAFPKQFLGTTVVNRDNVRRWRWGKDRPKLEKVRLESSQFERIFEVMGSDQVEARYLVHPAFMERLMAVEAASAGRDLRCAFHEGDLMIVIEGGNLFEIVEVFKPIPNREQTRKGVSQIGEVLGLIDAVMAPPPKVYG